jgi:hypothetical protein
VGNPFNRENMKTAKNVLIIPENCGIGIGL